MLEALECKLPNGKQSDYLFSNQSNDNKYMVDVLND